VLGTKDPIPRPRIGGFDHALKSTYLRTTNAAVTAIWVSFRHLLEQSYVAASLGTRVSSQFVGSRPSQRIIALARSRDVLELMR
jgi:hypothetical protein